MPHTIQVALASFFLTASGSCRDSLANSNGCKASRWLRWTEHVIENPGSSLHVIGALPSARHRVRRISLNRAAAASWEAERAMIADHLGRLQAGWAFHSVLLLFLSHRH